jgi:dihydroxyacetone kinase
MMELGLGIHGEDGVEKCLKQSADELVSTLLEKILGSRLKDAISADKRVAVLLNNLGTATDMEMKIVLRATLKELTGAFTDTYKNKKLLQCSAAFVLNNRRHVQK